MNTVCRDLNGRKTAGLALVQSKTMLGSGRTPQHRSSRLFYCCMLTFTGIIVIQVFVIWRLASDSEELGDKKVRKSKLHMIQPKVASKNLEEEKAETMIQPDSHMCGNGGDVAFYRASTEGFWICVHERSDVVSNRIRSSGAWDDCEDEVWLLWTLFAANGREGSQHAFANRAWMGKQRGSHAKEQSSTETGRPLVILDVGANIGACSVRLAQLGHMIISFEPLPENFLRLQGSIGINNLSDTLTAVNKGLAESTGSREALSENGNLGNTLVFRNRPLSGTAELAAVSSVQNSSFAQRQVEVVRLDAFWAGLEPRPRAVDLLKLDCQGCELGALRGAGQLVEEGLLPLIVAEFSPPHLLAAGHDPEELLEWLHMKGYEISTLLMGREVRPSEFAEFAGQHRNRAVDILARRDPAGSEAKRGGEGGRRGGWLAGLVKEKRDGVDRGMFLLLCAIPIAFGCTGMVWTMTTL